MPSSHLTPMERGQIEALRNQGLGVRAIGRALNRCHTCISRELRRNSGRTGYAAQTGQQRYEQRRKACRPAKRLRNRPLWDHLIERITSRWTPEQVANSLPLEYPDDPSMRISHEAIYQAIYTDERLHVLIEYLPQARPKRRKRGQGKSRRGPSIPNRVGIDQRPPQVQNRERYGDWEGDTIVGATQRGFVVSLVERESLQTCLRKVQTKHAQPVSRAVIDALEDFPESWLKTLTFDNGTEFAHHQEIALALPVDIYFADPYASYQRGTNENTNGLVRRYLPKGTNFANITQDQLDAIADELNNRPRKKLAYRTPNQVFQKLCALKRRGALRP